ncbi:DNA mismatch repair protein MSH3, partial [Mucuna pruriens]
MRPELADTLALILTTLGRALDVQRGMTNVFHCTATCLSAIGNAAKVLSSLNKDSVDQGEPIKLIIASEGQFPEVVRIWKAFKMAMEQLDSLIRLYHKWFGMQNLELMSSFGTTHLIELSTDVSNSVKHYVGFLAVVQALAAFDCLHSLAIISRSMGCVRLVFDHKPIQMQICFDKHLVFETTLLDKFVQNDTNRHADGEYCQIVIGSNYVGSIMFSALAFLIPGFLAKAKPLQDEQHINVYQPASVAASLCTIEERALIAKASSSTPDNSSKLG